MRRRRASVVELVELNRRIDQPMEGTVGPDSACLDDVRPGKMSEAGQTTAHQGFRAADAQQGNWPKNCWGSRQVSILLVRGDEKMFKILGVRWGREAREKGRCPRSRYRKQHLSCTSGEARRGHGCLPCGDGLPLFSQARFTFRRQVP